METGAFNEAEATEFLQWAAIPAGAYEEIGAGGYRCRRRFNSGGLKYDGSILQVYSSQLQRRSGKCRSCNCAQSELLHPDYDVWHLSSQ